MQLFRPAEVFGVARGCDRGSKLAIGPLDQPAALSPVSSTKSTTTVRASTRYWMAVTSGAKPQSLMSCGEGSAVSIQRRQWLPVPVCDREYSVELSYRTDDPGGLDLPGLLLGGPDSWNSPERGSSGSV